jgi:pimeloyl-ACP methyl ester carboxylesterase
MPPNDVKHRLSHSLRLSELPAAEFAATMLPTLFSTSAPRKRVEPFAASVAKFHPNGFRTMALASADADLRDVLPRIDVPTLLLHAEADIRAQRFVAEALHASIPSSTLMVLSGIGHVSSVEAPEQFNEAIRFSAGAKPHCRIAGLSKP